MMMKVLGREFTLPLIFFLLLSCTKQKPDLNLNSDEEKLYSQGKTTYMVNCISCHNPQPKLEGSIGPSNYGSSLELLRAKILHGVYPSGYKPKRDTHLMPTFDDFEKNLEGLHVFLNH
jgi:mono/diheme cytochrome c family protein